MSGRRAVTLIDLLMTMAILGVIAAIVVPRYSIATDSAAESNVMTQLFTIRHQMELYNANFPADPYDYKQGWAQLVENDYLQMAPENPLQNGATDVDKKAKPGHGWVWADPSGSGVKSIYAVDQYGNLFDFDDDGQPD